MESRSLKVESGHRHIHHDLGLAKPVGTRLFHCRVTAMMQATFQQTKCKQSISPSAGSFLTISSDITVLSEKCGVTKT